MSFLSILQRTQPARVPSSPDHVIWGVRRKRGYSEIDDPATHRGLVQHAFSVDDYSIALCGTKTYAWRRPRHIRLAVPTEENPSCRKCSLAIAFDVSEAVSMDRLVEMTTPVGRSEVEDQVRAARKALAAAEPIQIEAARRERVEPRAWPIKDFSQAA